MTEKRAKTFTRFDAALAKNIPAELKKLRQWVCWTLCYDEGKPKPRKVPMSPSTGYAVAVNQQGSKRWADFDAAVAAVDRFRFHGVGFVFTPADPYCGIDLDDCRDAATGEFGEWATAIMGSFATYREISPSGTGVKMIVRGRLPGEGVHRAKFEVYDRDRYFTTTGWVPPGEKPLAIADRQEELDRFYADYIAAAPPAEVAPAPATPDFHLESIQAIPDAVLIERASAAANGAKFKRLWDGATTEYGEDASRADMALCCLLAYWTRRDAARVDRLFRQSGLMRKKWDERHGAQTYGAKTVAKAISETTAVYDPSAVGVKNDKLNAEVFVELHHDRFAYCSAWKTWLEWDGACWRSHRGTEESQVYMATSAVEKHFLERIASEPDADARKELFRWATQTGERRRIEAMVRLAAARMDCPPAMFDRDPMLLTCANGTVDLRTAKLRPHDRGDFITRSAGASFAPAANCPVFDAFMTDIMQGDEGMIKYLWRVMGYALSGDVRERAFFILHGVGRNGKTTFLETLLAMVGGYGQKARFTSFLRSKIPGGTGPNDDVAHMAGARVIVAAETEEGATLNTSMIKELTGGDMVRARFLYGKEFEFRPQAKIFLCTNSVPNIWETSHAVWDRIHYVPFGYRVPAEKVDKTLLSKIFSELDAILARAVLAGISWQAQGLLPPEKVISSGNELRTDSDVFGEWLDACCEVDLDDETAEERVADLHASYRKWLENSRGRGSKPRAPVTLVRYLVDRGCERKIGHSNVKFVRFIRLRTFSA